VSYPRLPFELLGLTWNQSIDLSARGPQRILPKTGYRGQGFVARFRTPLEMLPNVRSWQIVLQKSQLDLRCADAQYTPKMGFLAPTP